MVSDAGARIVVTQDAHIPLATRVHPGELVVLERDEAAIAGYPSANPGRAYRCGPPDLRDLHVGIHRAGPRASA